MKRRLGWVLLLLVVVTPISSGAADAEPIGLSSDGSAFGPGLSRPLFDSSVSWVPGDVRESTFYVRNQGGSTARMTIDVLGRPPGELLASGDLAVTAGSPCGTSRPAAEDTGEHLLLEEHVVADGEIVPVTIRLAYAGGSANPTQLLVNDLDFRVTLTQTAERAISPSSATTAARGDLDGLLPDTGAPALVVPALLALLCLGTGAVLIARRPDNKGASHG